MKLQALYHDRCIMSVCRQVPMLTPPPLAKSRSRRSQSINAIACISQPACRRKSRSRFRCAALLQTLAGLAGNEESRDNPHLARNRTLGVVIVDHGSKRDEANSALLEFGRLYTQACRHDIVEVAHMELAEPSISQAIRKCVERGASHIVVAPYFLSRGRHVQSDIPRLAEEAQAEHPGVQVQVAEPIGALLLPLPMSRREPEECGVAASRWLRDCLDCMRRPRSTLHSIVSRVLR
jgi:sirohydrochlorin ferrochelatase